MLFGYSLFAVYLPLSFWILLWKIVLVVSVLLFGSLAVWVSIGGLFDIKRLIAKIVASHEEEGKQGSQTT